MRYFSEKRGMRLPSLFVKFCNAITDGIFLVVLMRYFSEKNVGCDAIFDAIAIPATLYQLITLRQTQNFLTDAIKRIQTKNVITLPSAACACRYDLVNCQSINLTTLKHFIFIICPIQAAEHMATP